MDGTIPTPTTEYQSKKGAVPHTKTPYRSWTGHQGATVYQPRSHSRSRVLQPRSRERSNTHRVADFERVNSGTDTVRCYTKGAAMGMVQHGTVDEAVLRKQEEQRKLRAQAGQHVTGAVIETPVPGLDILREVAGQYEAFSVPTTHKDKNNNTTTDRVPSLSAHNQEAAKRCAAAAMCTAMFLRAMQLATAATKPLLTDVRNMPSPVHAYHAQCRMRCLANARCKCGAACDGVCDDCGSMLTTMVDACQRGVVTEAVWPTADGMVMSHVKRANQDRYLVNKPYYRLGSGDGIEWLDVTAKQSILVKAVQKAITKGFPVIINMLVYPSQMRRFYERQFHAPGYAAGKSVFDNEFLLPKPLGSERSQAMGHCMLIVGVNLAKRRFRVRNSSGASWGYDGDMCIGFDALSPWQVNGLLVIKEVTLHNARMLVG